MQEKPNEVGLVYFSFSRTLKTLLLFWLIGITASCSSQYVLQRTEVNEWSNSITELVSASVLSDKILAVCVKGDLEESSASMFWIELPIEQLESATQTLNRQNERYEEVYLHEDYYLYTTSSFREVPTWTLPLSSVHLGACPQQGAAVTLKRLGDAPKMRYDIWVDRAYQEGLVAVNQEAVYEMSRNDQWDDGVVHLAYANPRQDFGGKSYMRFKLARSRVDGSNAWYLLMPFAIAADIVTLPVQFWMLLNSGH